MKKMKFESLKVSSRIISSNFQSFQSFVKVSSRIFAKFSKFQKFNRKKHFLLLRSQAPSVRSLVPRSLLCRRRRKLLLLRRRRRKLLLLPNLLSLTPRPFTVSPALSQLPVSLLALTCDTSDFRCNFFHKSSVCRHHRVRM